MRATARRRHPLPHIAAGHLGTSTGDQGNSTSGRRYLDKRSAVPRRAVGKLRQAVASTSTSGRRHLDKRSPSPRQAVASTSTSVASVTTSGPAHPDQRLRQAEHVRPERALTPRASPTTTRLRPPDASGFPHGPLTTLPPKTTPAPVSRSGRDRRQAVPAITSSRCRCPNPSGSGTCPPCRPERRRRRCRTRGSCPSRRRRR